MGIEAVQGAGMLEAGSEGPPRGGGRHVKAWDGFLETWGGWRGVFIRDWQREKRRITGELR